MDGWKFDDVPNVAVITNKMLLDGRAWIGYVSHDSDDGTWQFHCGGNVAFSMEDAALVTLRSIVKLDPSVELLADLPLGWYAWRDSPQSSWKRAPSVD